METKVKDHAQQDVERLQVEASHSGEREGEGELPMEQTQQVVEELQRGGGLIETHADGTGVVTIWLKWPRTGRQPISGRGHSFPAALSDLMHAVER